MDEISYCLIVAHSDFLIIAVGVLFVCVIGVDREHIGCARVIFAIEGDATASLSTGSECAAWLVTY